MRMRMRIRNFGLHFAAGSHKVAPKNVRAGHRNQLRHAHRHRLCATMPEPE